MSSTLE